MDDLISRKALLAEYDRVHIGEPGKARKLMEDAPAVDAVEVVRCKDCKHYWKNVNTPGYAGKCTHVEDDDFCSHGERRSDV